MRRSFASPQAWCPEKHAAQEGWNIGQLGQQETTIKSLSYLHALEKQGHDVRTGNELLHVASQTLGQTAQEIQGNDHEVFVRGLVLVWMLIVHLFKHSREAFTLPSTGNHSLFYGLG